MKTKEEWLEIYRNNDSAGYSIEQKENLLTSIFQDIQSDAFHAGKLEGLSEAREICRQKFDAYDEESTLGALLHCTNRLKTNKVASLLTLYLFMLLMIEFGSE